MKKKHAIAFLSAILAVILIFLGISFIFKKNTKTNQKLEEEFKKTKKKILGLDINKFEKSSYVFTSINKLNSSNKINYAEKYEKLKIDYQKVKNQFNQYEKVDQNQEEFFESLNHNANKLIESFSNFNKEYNNDYQKLLNFLTNKLFNEINHFFKPNNSCLVKIKADFSSEFNYHKYNLTNEIEEKYQNKIFKIKKEKIFERILKILRALKYQDSFLNNNDEYKKIIISLNELSGKEPAINFLNLITINGKYLITYINNKQLFILFIIDIIKFIVFSFYFKILFLLPILIIYLLIIFFSNQFFTKSSNIVSEFLAITAKAYIFSFFAIFSGKKVKNSILDNFENIDNINVIGEEKILNELNSIELKNSNIINYYIGYFVIFIVISTFSIFKIVFFFIKNIILSICSIIEIKNIIFTLYKKIRNFCSKKKLERLNLLK